MDSIGFITVGILDYTCSTMSVPVKPIKYTRDEHFLLEDIMQKVMGILHVFYHDGNPSSDKGFGIGEIDISEVASQLPTYLYELLVIRYADGA